MIYSENRSNRMKVISTPAAAAAAAPPAAAAAAAALPPEAAAAAAAAALPEAAAAAAAELLSPVGRVCWSNLRPLEFAAPAVTAALQHEHGISVHIDHMPRGCCGSLSSKDYNPTL